MVWFIFREEYYHDAIKPQTPDETSSADLVAKYNEWEQKHLDLVNKAAVIIAKQRHGSTGMVQLRFEAEFTKFSDLARGDQRDYQYD
jgi:replicative DNA helicase